MWECCLCIIILQVATMVAIMAFPPSLLLLLPSPPLPSPPSPLHLPPHKAEIYLPLLFSTIQVQVLDMSLAVTVKILCATFQVYSVLATCIQHMCVHFAIIFSILQVHRSALLVLQTGLELISHQTISLRSYG